MNLDVKILTENIVPSSCISFVLKFQNNTNNLVYIEDITVTFQCNCALSVLNLRRHHKTTDINRYIQNIEEHCQFSSFKKNIDSRSVSTVDFLISKKEKVIFEKRSIDPNEIFEGTFKLKLPQEIVGTYKSKNIQFCNTLLVSMFSNADESRQCLELNVPVKARSNFVLNEKLDTSDDEADDDEQNNEDNDSKNPFIINIIEKEDQILGSNGNLDPRHAVNYKINYKDDYLCMIALLKVPVIIGEDMKFWLDFYEDSKYRCVKFSASIHATETLLIPSNEQIEPEPITISEQELGPNLFDIACCKSLPITLRIPNNHWYPSLEHDIFHFSWSVRFVFMITPQSELAEPNINVINLNKDTVWSLDLHKKSDILTWDLPIRVIEPLKSPQFNLYSS